jgi:hypothetical protein
MMLARYETQGDTRLRYAEKRAAMSLSVCDGDYEVHRLFGIQVPTGRVCSGSGATRGKLFGPGENSSTCSSSRIADQLLPPTWEGHVEGYTGFVRRSRSVCGSRFSHLW